jgi:hypothetical protein
MNVLQTEVPSKLSFDDMARTEVQQISRASGIKHIRQQETRVPAGRALHLTYRPRPNAVIQQYFVRHGNLLYVLTYSTRAADEARYAKVFDQSGAHVPGRMKVGIVAPVLLVVLGSSRRARRASGAGATAARDRDAHRSWGTIPPAASRGYCTRGSDGTATRRPT